MIHSLLKGYVVFIEPEMSNLTLYSVWVSLTGGTEGYVPNISSNIPSYFYFSVFIP